MWWIVGTLGGLAVAALLSNAENQKLEARARWARKREEVSQTIDDHRQNIERHISSCQSTIDFHLLTGLHFSSSRIADEAYRLLRDAGESLNGINKLLLDSREKKLLLEYDLRTVSSLIERKRIIQEVSHVRDFRNQLFNDKDRMTSERDALKEKLRFLNNQTHSLKIAIRDRCGAVGLDWYSRLEARAAARRRDLH